MWRSINNLKIIAMIIAGSLNDNILFNYESMLFYLLNNIYYSQIKITVHLTCPQSIGSSLCSCYPSLFRMGTPGYPRICHWGLGDWLELGPGSQSSGWVRINNGKYLWLGSSIPHLHYLIRSWIMSIMYLSSSLGIISFDFAA